MASFTTLITSLPKFGSAGATIAKARAWNPRVFAAAATPRHIQVPRSPNQQEGSVTTDGVQQGASETVNNSITSDSVQDKAYSTTEHVANKTRDTANHVSNRAQDISEKAKQSVQETWESAKDTANRAASQNIAEKAKQTMQETWDSAKNTANKAADTVLGKAQESAEYVKENAETIRKNMNKKN